jgi:cobalt-zinc-cadmium efflux system outer membrane protein
MQPRALPFLAATLWAGTVSAGPPPPPADRAPVALLLADSGELARWLVDRSPEARAAAARLNQARADEKSSHLVPNPSLNVFLNDVPVGTTNPPGLTLGDTAIYGFSVSQTLELGKRGPRIASAKLRLSSAAETYLGALSATLGDARAALGRVAYFAVRKEALTGSLAAVRENLDLQHSRLDNGDISGNDYDRLLLDATVLEADVGQTAADFEAALASCQATLQAPCDPAGAASELLASAAPVPVRDSGWEEAVSKRPDLKALDLLAQSADQDATLARHRAIPDPALAVGYTRDRLVISGDQPRTLAFGVTLPLPLFDHGQHDAARAQDRALETRSTAAAQAAQAHADLEGLNARRLALEASVARLRADALPRSKMVLESTVAAVNQGELSMTDLLLSRRTHTDLVLRVLDLDFAAFLARNDLRRALGLDGELLRGLEGVQWKTE